LRGVAFTHAGVATFLEIITSFNQSDIFNLHNWKFSDF